MIEFTNKLDWRVIWHILRKSMQTNKKKKKRKEKRVQCTITWESVGTTVGSNSSQCFGSIGTQTRPGANRINKHSNKGSIRWKLTRLTINTVKELEYDKLLLL